VTPFVGAGGTAGAFVTDKDDPDINDTTLTGLPQFVGIFGVCGLCLAWSGA
jgi:hypothetical protein